nr:MULTISPECIES: glycosyltransferase [Cryobacterium]
MASHVSTVCEDALRKPILRPVAQKIIGVVPNGVDPVTASASDRAASRRSLAIGDDDIVLIIVARLVRDKGHLDLLQALMTIESGPLDADAKVHLVVVGDGPDSAEISRQARLLTRFHVHLLGRRHDVAALLAAADIAVMPSWHENMSNALLEAMAAGLPVVVTSVGGNTEVLAQGGGLLVPPSDERALAEAIRRLLVDVALREALGVEARTVFESRYTTGHMTTRLSEIYNLILES